MKAIVLAACVACFAACFPDGASAETVERSAQAPAKGRIEIVNVAGTVAVIGWDRAQVQMKADLGRDVERVDFERDGDRTLIEVKIPKKGGRSSVSSRLVIHVPQGSDLVVNTVSASQSIENVRGEQRLQSVSGSIESQLWSEDFQAKSVSGAIDLRGRGQSGSVRVTSVSGAIRIDDHGGDMELNSVNGALQLNAAVLSRARLKTTNGQMRIVAALARDARIEAESINGAIGLMLQGKVAAEFDIETFNGGIDNCFGPDPVRTSKYAPGRELRFKEGSGGDARVRLKTLNGAIELCKGR
jgi:DUF4097 and DUF4098 domain-containing protein YvlB